MRKNIVMIEGKFVNLRAVEIDDLENDRPRHKINKVGDGGAGIGYDSIGEDIID